MNTQPLISSLADLRESSYPNLVGQDIHTIIQTNKFSQISTVCLKPQENIGFERHNNPESDQIVIVLQGNGTAMLGRDVTDTELVFYDISISSLITIPAGMRHEIYNTSETNFMKLLIIYTPPIH